jgi:hypothetical protein
MPGARVGKFGLKYQYREMDMWRGTFTMPFVCDISKNGPLGQLRIWQCLLECCLSDTIADGSWEFSYKVQNISTR